MTEKNSTNRINKDDPQYQVFSLVSAYQPTDGEESAAKSFMLQFILDHSNCLERSLAIGHITTGALVTNQKKDKVLLVHHKKYNIWVQPGGHADGNPHLKAAAAQEVLEETGISSEDCTISDHLIDISIHLLKPHKSEPAHFHYDCNFLCVADDKKAIKISERESHDARWFSVNQLEQLFLETKLMRMVEKLKRNNYG